MMLRFFFFDFLYKCIYVVGTHLNCLDLKLVPTTYLPVSVFTKTEGLSDKTSKFSFCPVKIFSLSDSCPATLFNCQILITDIFFHFFKTSFAFTLMCVCVEVLWPSQPNGVMSSVVHILSPETDNCPSWISGRERMTVENISWSISTKGCYRPRRGLNPRPPGLQSDWATEVGLPWCFWVKRH